MKRFFYLLQSQKLKNKIRDLLKKKTSEKGLDLGLILNAGLTSIGQA